MTAVGRGPARLLIVVIAVLFLMGCSTGQQAGPATEPSFGPAFRPLPAGVPGRQLYISPDLQGARWQRAHGAAWLAPLTRVPQARWVNSERDLPSLKRAARDVKVTSPGGTQRVEWTADGIFLTGWAELVFTAVRIR